MGAALNDQLPAWAWIPVGLIAVVAIVLAVRQNGRPSASSSKPFIAAKVVILVAALVLLGAGLLVGL